MGNNGEIKMVKLTIDEVSIEKRKLEAALKTTLNNFEKRTGLYIANSLEIYRENTNKISKPIFKVTVYTVFK